MSMTLPSAPFDPRSRRMQRVHVVAVGTSGMALTDGIQTSASVQVEQVEPRELLERLRTLVDEQAEQMDSLIVVVHQSEDMHALATGEESWRRSGPLITTIFIHEAGSPAPMDEHWTLDGNLMLLRATSDQLVITADASYPAEVVRALTH